MLLYLQRVALKLQIFRRPTLPVGLSSSAFSNWNLRTLAMGILCFPAGLIWTLVVLEGTKRGLVTDQVFLLFLLPSLVAPILGVYLIAKGLH